MDLKDLWTGEKVMVKSTGRTGTFEGINKDGKARIKAGDKIYLVSGSNLEVVPDQEIYPDIHEFLNNDKQDKNIIGKPIKVKLDLTIDLHIEKLAPHMENELPGRILEFQIERSRLFINHAVEKNYPHITIIHGKGQGVLKSEIEHLLKEYQQVRFTFSKNGGGAVEVWL